MDDDGQKQRLLDVIGDPHALETFLETFPSSQQSFPTDGLLWQGLDSPRFDNVTSSTDSGLVSSCLDSLVFDGQFLGQVRGGGGGAAGGAGAGGATSATITHPHHPHSHPHPHQPQHPHQLNPSQVAPHVLQQVLPSPTLSSTSSSSTSSSVVLAQSAAGSQTTGHSHQHHQLQQPEQQQSQEQQQQQHEQQPQPHTIQQQNVALQVTGAPLVAGAPSADGTEGSRENEHPTLQQLLASSATFPVQPTPQQSSSQPQSLHQPSAGHGLPPTVLAAPSLRHPTIQQAILPTQQQQASIQSSPRPVKQQTSPATKSAQTLLLSTSQPPTPHVITQTHVQPHGQHSAQQIMSSGVQLVGGPNQVITSGGQIITSAPTQLLPGTQLLQAPGSTQVLPTSQILHGGQVLHNGQVIQGGQVLPGPHLLHGGQLLQGGQVIQGGQVLQGGQIIQGNQVINNSHLITTTAHMTNTGGLGASAPLHVTSTPTIQQQSQHLQQQQQQHQQQQQQQAHTVTLHQSVQPGTPASPFSVLSKSPGSALPRTSPSPSPYHPTTPSPHQAVQSPASYTTRSPAPSPHTVGSMRSPAPPTPSPAATPTPQSHGSIAGLPQQQTPGMVMGNVGMMQSLVPQLPLSQVVGSNGMVLPQPGVQPAAPGVKQVVSGGQLIQIVSSPQPTQPRQLVTTPAHKPIQPKQPQLLPKPPQAPVVGQPAPPPPGKTLLSTKPVTPGSQQPIVIGTAGQQPTVMAGQQSLGGFVINPSMMQSGLQQPILIQQPNGSVLLVRPSGPSGAGGAPGQPLLVSMPGQPQMIGAGAKAGQPQTVVFPGSGQGGPAYVIPQSGAPSGLGAPGVMGPAQGARGPQPILRLVAPQAPLQLQQIQTPNGPALFAVPAGQTVNLQGLLTTGGATVRTLAPQVASGPLQLAPTSVPPPPVVSMGHIQIPGSGQQLQVSVPGAPLQLATSLPSSLPSVITTTKQTVIDDAAAPPLIVTAAETVTQHHTITDANKTTKKKSKKKKREKEPKDDKLKGKGTSINLNDILKETVGDLMLFDEPELSMGGEGIEGNITTTVPPVPTPPRQATTTLAPSVPLPPPAETATVSLNTSGESGGHFVIGTSQPHSLMGVNSLVGSTVVTSSATPGLITTTNMAGGMSFTLDPSGKFILGSDPTKATITTPATPNTQVGGMVLPGSQSQGLQVVGGVSNMGPTPSLVTLASSGAPSSMPTILPAAPGPAPTPAAGLPVGSLPSFTQLLTPPTHVTNHSVVQGSKAKPLQLQSLSKVTQVTGKNQTGVDISRVAQNTHLLQTLHLPASDKSSATSTTGQPLLTSLVPGPQAAGGTTGGDGGGGGGGDQVGVPVQVSVSEGGPMLTLVSVGGVVSLAEGAASTFSTPAPLSILVPSQASQVPPSSAVIVSSSTTNSVVSGAIISHKQFVSNSALIPHTTSVTYTNTDNVPISRGHSQIITSIQDNVPSQINNTSSFITKVSESHKSQTFQNEYVATVQRGQNFIDPNKNKSKSNKKKKKDKEVDATLSVNSSSVGAKQSLHERLKTSTGTTTSGAIQQQLSLAPIPNGLSSPAIKAVSHNLTPSGPVVSLPPREAGGHCDTSSFIGPAISVAPSATTVTVTVTTTTTPTSATTTPLAPGATTTSTTNTTTAATSMSPHPPPSGVVTPFIKQQFKQVKLILSPQNQEALKKVHSQIQALQTRKGSSGDGQDDSNLQQLCQEYRRIMATGKHVTVTAHHPPQISPTPSQPTAVRYSHPVGHKIITVTQFKQQIKHLPQEQQRQIMDQSKVVQRWKDPSSINPTSTVTSPPTIHTPTPHLSPPTTTSGCILTTKPTVSPGASMPTIATSSPSPTLPTTTATTTVSTSTSTPKMTPPPAPSPIPCPPSSAPTTPVSSVTHLGTLGSLPKALALPPPQTSPHPSVVTSLQDQSPGSQVKATTTYSITKEQLFEHQLKTDQNGALNPDYKTPFKNKIDACKRLIRYHVFNEPPPTPRDLAEANTQTELQAESLLKKFSNMKYKYQSLLVKESMRRHPSSETVMLYRLFLQEDKTSLEKEKSDIQNGKIVDLPSKPPPHPSQSTLAPDTPYPWELEWEGQKIYEVLPGKMGRLRRLEVEGEEEEEYEEEEEEYEDDEQQKVDDETENKDKKDIKVEEENEEMQKDTTEVKTDIKEESVKKEGQEEEEEDVVVEEVEDKNVVDKNEEHSMKQDKEHDGEKSNTENLKIVHEDDLHEFEDSQEGETRLHIHMDEEEEEEEEEEEDEHVEEENTEGNPSRTEKNTRKEGPLASKFNCSNERSDSSVVEEGRHLPSNNKLNSNSQWKSDSESLGEKEERKESEHEEEELVICDVEATSASQNNSPTAGNGESAVPENSGDVADNYSEDTMSRRSTSPSSHMSQVPGNMASKSIVNSPIVQGPPRVYPPVKIVSDRTEKEKRKEKTEKDRKKSDRTKVKERGKDREKEDRPPKRLKIKLKSEERALVPPLRIRTEERGIGLKLTLKKQEGSGAYYSVGEERKREYRVEQNQEEEEEDAEDMVNESFNNEEEEEDEEKEEGDEEGHNSLKEVKVVLQDVLKDKRFKKQAEEKGCKKRRRERSDERSDKNDKYNSNSHWVSYPQPYSQGDVEKRFTSPPSNHDNRNWNYNNSVEWRRSEEEGVSGVDHTGDQKAREYNSHLYSYGEGYGHEYPNRHNHSQNYGHSGTQQRNSHTYY